MKTKSQNGKTNGVPAGTMSLSDFATPLMAEHHFVKVSFGGFAGSGKSRTSSEFIRGLYKHMKLKKPLLFIDNEKGGRFLLKQFKADGINVIYKVTTSLADVIQAMEFLRTGEVDCLFIDTLTKVWYDYVRGYLKQEKKKFMTLQDWGKILPAWQETFADKYVEVNGNLIFTGRGGFQYEKEEDEKDEQGIVRKKGQFVKSGVKMKLAGETPFEPDLIVWMEQQQKINGNGLEIWREAQVMKDRSGTIDGKSFRNPTYKDFKPFVDYIVDIPIGKVTGPTNTESLAPTENYDYLRQKENKEIELEKIEAVYQKYGLVGSLGKEQHRVRVLVTEKVFDTSSPTEIGKKFNAYELGRRRTVLDKLLNELTELPDIKAKELHIKEVNINDLYELESQTQSTLS